MAMLVRYKCLDCGETIECMIMYCCGLEEIKCEHCGSENTEVVETDSI